MAANKFADPDAPIVYPGVMKTYPGMVKGQPPVYVHDCVPGCPGMPLRHSDQISTHFGIYALGSSFKFL